MLNKPEPTTICTFTVDRSGYDDIIAVDYDADDDCLCFAPDHEDGTRLYKGTATIAIAPRVLARALKMVLASDTWTGMETPFGDSSLDPDGAGFLEFTAPCGDQSRVAIEDVHEILRHYTPEVYAAEFPPATEEPAAGDDAASEQEQGEATPA